MKTPSFTNGRDETTFAPFVLIDQRDSKWSDVRLQFNSWELLQQEVGGDHLGDYYLNGPGVQGLVIASRIAAGLDPLPAGVEPNSEGDTCYMHFSDLDTAVETANLAQAMIGDTDKMKELAQIAMDEGLDDI